MSIEHACDSSSEKVGGLENFKFDTKKGRKTPITAFEKLVLEMTMDYGLSAVAAGEVTGLASASRLKRGILYERQMTNFKHSIMT